MNVPPEPHDPLEATLEALGREARQTPIDPGLPLRVEARVRLDLERRGLEPIATTRGAVAAAALLALGAWLFPGPTSRGPVTHGTTAPPPEVAPAVPEAPPRDADEAR